MQIILLAAMDRAGCIGSQGKLPWSIPEELRLFKFLTGNHPLIVGRKTFESMPKSVWETRRPLILSRSSPEETVSNSITSTSLSTLIEASNLYSDKAFIIGGAQVYTEVLKPEFSYPPDQLWLTRIPHVYSGDTFFPAIPSIYEPMGVLYASPEGSFITYRFKR